MSKIIIDISLFDGQGSVHFTDDAGQPIETKIAFDIEELAAIAAQGSQEKNINYIGISTTPAYGEMIKEKIQNILSTEYSNNDIEIEVF